MKTKTTGKCHFIPTRIVVKAMQSKGVCVRNVGMGVENPCALLEAVWNTTGTVQSSLLVPQAAKQRSTVRSSNSLSDTYPKIGNKNSKR